MSVFIKPFLSTLLFISLFLPTKGADLCFDSIKVLNNTGAKYYFSGDYRNAQKYFQLSLKHSIKCYSSNHPYVADEYNNLGVLSSGIWDYANALEYLNAAKNIYEQYDSLNNYLAISLSNIAMIYRLLGDYENASSYYQRAISLYDKELSSYSFDLRINTLMGMAWLENRKKNYSQAIEYIFTGLNDNQNFQNNERNTFFLYESLISFYNNSGKTDSLYSYLVRTNELTWNSSNLPEINKIQSTVLLADYYIKAENYQDAFKSLLIADSLLGTGEIFDLKKIEFYLTFADYYIGKKDFINAINQYKIALDIVQKGNSTNFESNDPLYAISVLKKYASGYIKWYQQTNDPQKLLAANKLILKATKITDQLRASFLSIENRLTLSENESTLYELGVYCSNILQNIFNEQKYIENAFYFAEKGKSAVLEGALKEERAKSFGGIPQGMLQQESELKREITFYKEKIYQEQNKPIADTSKLSIWNNFLIDYNQEYENLKEIYETQYPDYYKLKYESNEVSIEDIQKKLKRKTTILEFSVSDSALYTFVINKNSTQLYSKPIDSNFYSIVADYLNIFTGFNFISQSKNTYTDYEKIAHNVYKELFGFISKDLIKENLIIIPDNILSYLPFEALVKKIHKGGAESFAEMHYLLEDYSIHYAHSATLFNLSSGKNRPKLKNSFLAIAPEYSYDASNRFAQNIEISQEVFRNNLNPLPYAFEEVKKVSAITKGEFIHGKDATETLFKQKAPGYDILHLAMHTLIDDRNPLFSKLIFYHNNYLAGKGLLTTNEIFAMKLKANLTVLSACSTGEGEYRKGEGVMSLSRGFFYAGCPSLVMTLWKVEDKSGLDLMHYFYKYLKKGYSKSTALRKAKIDYLNNIPEHYKHPFFWSSYILIGDNTPLYYSFWHYAIATIFSLIIIVSLIRLIHRFK